jgi:osmotically-inducible protein OsmY
LEVRNGEVELSGFVSTYEERDAAVTLDAAVEGVGKVINSIDVTR